MKRTDALKKLIFEKRSFDGFLATNESSLLYLTGVPGLTSMLITRKGQDTVYVSGTNYEQAKAEAKGFKVELIKRGEKIETKLASQTKAFKITRLAADTMGHEFYRLLMKGLRGKVKLKMAGKLLWELRKVKDEKELELMRKAGVIAGAGMKVAYETVKPGAKEIEVAAAIEYEMRQKGGWGTAFDTIVASGIRSAFPHGGCTEKEIRRGDLVVVDIGATYHYYRSDITRTMVAGKPTAKQLKIYDIVKKAQEKAQQAIKPRARGKEIDGMARKVIVDADYGEYFVHALGHGIGLDAHEPPYLSLESKDRLVAGNVVTNEPGIYLPDFGGIRIEDTVLVRKRTPEKLTPALYTLEAAR